MTDKRKPEESRACKRQLDCPRYADACNGGQCQDECATNDQCDLADGYACNPTTKRCENQFACKAPECPGDSKCGGFQIQGFFGPQDVSACFPKEMFGTVNDGDACKFDFECKDPAKCIYVDAGACPCP